MFLILLIVSLDLYVASSKAFLLKKAVALSSTFMII